MIMFKRLFILIILVILFSDTIIKSQEATNSPDEFDPNNQLPIDKKRPSHYDENRYCDSCANMIRIAYHLLDGKKSEADIYDIIDQMFTSQAVQVIPDKEKIMAEHIISIWEEEFIASLRNGKDSNNSIFLFCIQGSQVNYKTLIYTIQACQGVQKRGEIKLKQQKDEV